MRTDTQPRLHRLAHRPGDRRHMWCPPPVGTLVPPNARSCCCPAPAVYAVVLSDGDGHSHAPVLLCRHHARRSLPALARDGVAVFDVAGPLYDARLVAA